jgi:hypothetical protein
MSSHSSDPEKALHDTRPANDSAVPQVNTRSSGEAPPAYHVATQVGVLKVEAAQRVWGPKLKIALWVGVALISCQSLAVLCFAALENLSRTGMRRHLFS